MNASYAAPMKGGIATTVIALDVGTLVHRAVQHYHRLVKSIHPNVIPVITSVIIAVMDTVLLLANLLEQNMLYHATDMKMVE